MKVLITGIAGFIGYHLARRLIAEGVEIAGVDNINAYYDVGLKHARLAQLGKGFKRFEIDIADHEAFAAAVDNFQPAVIVHLAAQPGVRYSLLRPFEYARANLIGHLSVIEACRHARDFSHLIYASSSSVYGETGRVPFEEGDRADTPVSLYGATKRCDELMSSSYAHLFGINQIGLRFFTVYGSWGRPDMAYWMFAEKILRGEPIDVFNHGHMRRDMTHVTDVIDGIFSAIVKAPVFAPDERAHRVYNVGNHRPERLIDMIACLENIIGRSAVKVLRDMQPGDVTETFADISRFRADYGYDPKISMPAGLAEFMTWFGDWRSAGASSSAVQVRR
jgi:UDP-glucuronate 4-epimerase